MSMFKRFVEPGRLALITFGPCAGKMYLGVDSLGKNLEKGSCVESCTLVLNTLFGIDTLGRERFFFPNSHQMLGSNHPDSWGEIFCVLFYFYFFWGGGWEKNTKFLCLEMCVWLLVGGEVGVVFFFGLVDGGVSFFVLGGRGEVLFFYGEYTHAAKR